VLLVRRNPAARFMGGAWVFPGGAIERGDGEGELAAAAAAGRRELREEAGIELGADAEMIPFARWITPEEVPIRFDTWFLLAPAPEGAEPVVDGGEVVASGWWTPAGALAAGGRGELLLVFPTIKQLEALAPFGSVEELFADARGRPIEPVLPKVARAGVIVLPDGREETLRADSLAAERLNDPPAR
jgi:8-oxo-dGTP pyrophosphatase MutT (NUDIX family)